jgi:tetratricopeptide (TPR) repeat protein
MRVWRATGWVVLLCFLFATLPSVAHAQSRYDKARELYKKGKSAFEANQYQEAYDAFKQAYLLSQEPALLYNIASALQGLDRPHDAAEALRSYLRTVPNDPDKPEIEKRIANLEEAQRVLDNDRQRAVDEERRKHPPVEPPRPAEPVPTPATVTPAEAPVPEGPSKSELRGRGERRAGIALLVIGVVVAGGGAVCSVLAKSASDSVADLSTKGGTFAPDVESSGKTFDVLGGVLYGVGGAAVLAGVALSVIGWHDLKKSKRASLTPVLGPNHAGAQLRLSF